MCSDIPQNIREEWTAALTHARVSPQSFRLWLCPPPPQSPCGSAAWFRPGFVIPDAPEEILRGQQREEANSLSVRQLHRIAVLDRFDPEDPYELALISGRLRHEIEHAIQWDDGGGERLWELDLITDEIIAWKAGPPPGCLPLYRRKPREEDANAAASAFLRERHSDVVDRISRGDDAELVRSRYGPPDPRTLLARTVCFQFLFQDLTTGVDGVADWADHIDAAAPGTGDMWRRLRALLPPAVA